MVPADIHDFFAASAGVAGALIGLLFVAISVSADRLAKGQVHRIRAYAALIAFTNALAVSLFALLPGDEIGTAGVVVSLLGLLFVAAALLSLIRFRILRWPARPWTTAQWTAIRDALFLVGLAVVFVCELLAAIDVSQRPGDSGPVDEIGNLVIVCFLVGVAQAWALIGGPSIGIAHEVVALVEGQRTAAASRAEGPDGPTTGSQDKQSQ